MIRLRSEQVWPCNVTRHHRRSFLIFFKASCIQMYEATASYKDITQARVTNWEPHGVMLTGYCYTVRHRMKVQLITHYRVSHLQRYNVTVRGEVTSVYPPLCCTCSYVLCPLITGNASRYLSTQQTVFHKSDRPLKSTSSFTLSLRFNILHLSLWDSLPVNPISSNPFLKILISTLISTN